MTKSCLGLLRRRSELRTRWSTRQRYSRGVEVDVEVVVAGGVALLFIEGGRVGTGVIVVLEWYVGGRR